MARFEVQARVLDLLGLQQIANCPTAISELFKNAWDAYARKVSLDVYTDRGQAILWDNGIGMTEDELLHRWLVVGAAGKEDLPKSITPPEGMQPRPIQGEKGIGRLAISTLGDTLLLISRSRTPKNPREPFVALLINWNIVRNNHLLLSDLDIPQITFSSIDELSTGVVLDMTQDLRRALLSPEQAYAWDAIPEPKKKADTLRLRDLILSQLDTFSIETPIIARTIQEANTECGTIFYIGHLKNEFTQYTTRPTRYEDGQGAFLELVQLLGNFRNEFDSDESVTNPDMRSDIRLWDIGSKALRSLFRETAIFDPEDLRLYDHHVDVQFDEHARFEGHLEIYGKPVELPPIETQTPRVVNCGPFRLHLWYFQDKKDSRLDPEQWTLINNKLIHFGGLMVYRDGLRVLPYGRPEFDWLRFEERRSKGASYYFFSYRRMFGYVSIKRRENPLLIDKAGREGFISNSAYRDFREVLENFFFYLARQHFSKEAPFAAAKEEIKAEREVIEQERKRASQLKKELKDEAARKILFIKNKASEQLAFAFQEATQNLEGLEQQSDPSAAAYALLRFEDKVAQVKGAARLVIPRNLSITRDRELNRLRHDHEVAFEAFSSHCDEVRRNFEHTVESKFPEAQDVAGRQRVIEQSYNLALARLGKSYRLLRAELDSLTKGLEKELEHFYTQFRDLVERALLDSTGTKTVEAARTAKIENIAEVLGKIGEATNNSVDQMEAQQDRLRASLGGLLGGAKDKLIAAQTGEIEQLQGQANQNLELVQLGLAVEIIDHDLTKFFLGIRSSLAKLQNLLKNTPRASKPLDDLRSSFTHLEQRFRLMSPIYRGSYRLKTEIDGRRILAYCREFLGNQLRSARVTLDASDAFASFKIREVEAVVLPVFVNLIDNAIYWLREVNGERRILLDARGSIITICDTGPGIHQTQIEVIFEPFVSNKPNGRGLGLYIAQANLQRYGHQIWATNDPAFRVLSGACICIRFHDDVIFPE